jgi:hypothetical protein
MQPSSIENPATPSATITLGERVGHALADPAPLVFCDAPELLPHRDAPWLAHWLAQRQSLSLAPSLPPEGTCTVPAALLERHAALVGASGAGKTRLLLHLLREHLRAGGSAVMLDVKPETVLHALALADQAGLPRERVTAVWPREEGRGVPGWPMLVGGSPAAVRQTVRQFVSLVKDNAASWGVRLGDVLANAATVIAGQGLSVIELTRFLQREDYRNGLLARTRRTGAWADFPEEHAYWEWEFARWNRGEQTAAVAPVLNKVRSLVSIGFLRAMLGAERDDLDLPGLWRTPRLVAVHLDVWTLGQEGVRLLAGMLAHRLFATAMGVSGPVSVLLCLDEAAMQERFLGGTVADILALGRSRNLRLLLACQHLDQMSDSLRQGVLTNTALKVFFRLGPDDARRAAASLTGGGGSRITKVALGVAGSEETFLHPVVDEQGKRVSLSPAAWTAFQKDGRGTLAALRILASRSGYPRLLAVAPGTRDQVELGTYLWGLPPAAYSFLGPSPLQLAVRFPTPKVTVLERTSDAERQARLARLLESLPVRHAVVRTDIGETAQIRTVDVRLPGRLPDIGLFLGNGQDEQAIRETEGRRAAAIDTASGRAAPAPVSLPHHLTEPEVDDDGTL